ncbi:hypothetical protein J6590_018058 [Homalodisca vitripennis]|nr:hypothetical protein J6590_018058 [Homalodisca vitripennis]
MKKPRPDGTATKARFLKRIKLTGLIHSHFEDWETRSNGTQMSSCYLHHLTSSQSRQTDRQTGGNNDATLPALHCTLHHRLGPTFNGITELESCRFSPSREINAPNVSRNEKIIRLSRSQVAGVFEE